MTVSLSSGDRENVGRMRLEDIRLDRRFAAATVLACLAGGAAVAQLSFARGTVTMEDGSVPPRSVLIQRYCGAGRVMVEATTNRKGEFVLRASQFESTGDWGGRSVSAAGTLKCVLRAELPGYESSVLDLDDRSLGAAPTLPPLVLRRKGSRASAAVEAGVDAPRKARKAWDAALAAMGEGAHEKAEFQLRAVLRQAPHFAPAWNALGAALQNQKKLDDARQAYRRGMEEDPKTLTPELLLMRLESDAKNWSAAATLAASVLSKDKARRHPEALLHQAAAEYHLGHLEQAEASAAEAVRLDAQHRLPNAEYIYGLLLEARRDFAGAATHYRRFLELEPRAAVSQALRLRLENLGKGQPAPALPVLEDVALDVKAVAEAPVPGGLQALAAIAHSGGAGDPGAFFAGYCRALIRYMQPSDRAGIPGYLDSLRAYFSAIPVLAALGEPSGALTSLSISLQTPGARGHAEKVLALLGWRLAVVDGVTRVELSDAQADIPRQRVAAALGIDEIALRDALEGGRSYEFQVQSGDAPLLGGNAWLEVVSERQALAGGLAEAFTRDLRLAKVYAGLSAAGTDGAAALVSAFGLRTLAARHAETLSKHGAALHVVDGRAAAPGGPECDTAWQRLAGASPRQPGAFYAALLDKDAGRLAALYFALAAAGEPKARFVLASQSRSEMLYRLFSENKWHPDTLALDASGRLLLPGGRAVWLAAGGTEDSLFAPELAPSLEAVARLERQRGRELGPASAALLRQHWQDWQPLWPLFARLPELSGVEFAAFERFDQSLRAASQEPRKEMLGVWQAVAELIALGREAGSLDGASASSAFRRLCANPSQWRRLLRDISGPGGTLDEAVRDRLLRLTGTRRANYDRVLALQKSPGLEPNAKDPLTALTTTVYAAWLDPAALLVSEDPDLARKHAYAPAAAALFQPAVLEASSTPPGSRLTGGFAGFDKLARRLVQGAAWDPESEADPPPPPAAPSGPAAAPGETAPHVFRSDVRLVELYATVLDSRGRYVDDLDASAFEVLEEGQPQKLAAFEARASALSAALLLDSTLSMHPSMPALKNAALDLLRKLRPADSAAVYSFSDDVIALQPATTDRAAAARAIARLEARGETAVYDALVKTIREFASQQGKKVIVMITDGDDNRSTLTAGHAVRKAKAAGIPVYTIAQGMALGNRTLLRELEAVSKGTGGLAFAIRDAREVGAVFDAIARDLSHGYLLTIHPAAAQPGAWRRLRVQLKGRNGYQVRAREGYQSE